MGLSLYEVDVEYIKYLVSNSISSPHLFHSSQPGQQHSRKFIGVVLEIKNFKYFVPLSSFKEKHKVMKESIDFIKVGLYAVINLNNMFPVPNGLFTYVDFSKENDVKYRYLLLAEYRLIKAMQNRIIKNAMIVYRHKLQSDDTSLAKRCNDFKELEGLCMAYSDR